MNARRTTWLAWSLGLLCTALAAGSLLFGALNGTTPCGSRRTILPWSHVSDVSRLRPSRPDAH
jgi:hypothetical protein